jgi:hypothetical protein
MGAVKVSSLRNSPPNFIAGLRLSTNVIADRLVLVIFFSETVSQATL